MASTVMSKSRSAGVALANQPVLAARHRIGGAIGVDVRADRHDVADELGSIAGDHERDDAAVAPADEVGAANTQPVEQGRGIGRHLGVAQLADVLASARAPAARGR